MTGTGRPYLTATNGTIISRRYSNYTVGTVWGMSLHAGDDVELWVRRAIERGHDLVWVNQNAACVSDPPTIPKTGDQFEFGDRIEIDGGLYELRRANNGNVGLTRIEESFDERWTRRQRAKVAA